jgi:hypothetical protein
MTKSQEFIFPQPDEQGIRETKELYRKVANRELSDREAREALRRIMRYLFLLNYDQLHGSGENVSSTQHELELSYGTQPPQPGDTGRVPSLFSQRERSDETKGG